MAKKRKKSGLPIDHLQMKDGYASDRHDWVNKTGKSFRPKGENGKQFPRQRPADISK
jgi:hypothetical protein